MQVKGHFSLSYPHLFNLVKCRYDSELLTPIHQDLGLCNIQKCREVWVPKMEESPDFHGCLLYLKYLFSSQDSAFTLPLAPFMHSLKSLQK